MMGEWKRKDLLGIEELDRQEIEMIFTTTESFLEVTKRDIKKVPALRGKTIVNLFFEPSTRTSAAFELAAKRLSADTLNMSMSDSSTSKGETAKDTVLNIEAMKTDCVVVRHSCAGVPQMLARAVKASVINAGDGAHEHPTQGLLDVFTMRQKKGDISGLHVAIVGDILHSRVARSNIWCLKKLGARVTVCGPPTFIPSSIRELGVDVTYDLEDVLASADVINMLRIQLERQKGAFFPSIREYVALYGITPEKMRRVREDTLIMHPGPVNRGIELSPEVADGERSVILEQVTNGVAVRMAVLYLCCGGKAESDENTDK